MANQRLTDKSALEQQTGSGDLFMIVDVSDTSSSAEGTSKKIDSKYIIQTDKFSLNNAEVQALSHGASPKTLVGALTGYMVTPISATVLVTHAGSDETANRLLYFGYDSSNNLRYWDVGSKFFVNETADGAYVFGGNQPSGGVYTGGSILNKPFMMWSSGAFNGGWSMDVYLTYCYTKVL
jgi:hypothetical protein